MAVRGAVCLPETGGALFFPRCDPALDYKIAMQKSYAIPGIAEAEVLASGRPSKALLSP